MAYTENSANRMIELIKEIEARKEHANAAATYRDIPALQEIEKLVREQLASEEPYDHDTLTDSIFAVRYIGMAYETMWRIAYAVKYHKWLLELQLILYRRFREKDKECADDYYTALRARNYYHADTCSDLTEIASQLLPDKKRREIEKQVLENFHPLKHDPVELTDEYLSVIDEVEQYMDKEEIKRLHQFHRNELFQKLLRERGVEWRPITELNPGWHFD